MIYGQNNLNKEAAKKTKLYMPGKRLGKMIYKTADLLCQEEVMAGLR